MSKAIALDAAWIFAAFLVIIVFCAIGLAIRRMLLDRRGGTVECGLRRPGGTWRLGVAAYEKDELRWYDAVGVLLTPEEVLARRALAVVSRREVYPAEAALLGAGKVVVSCTVGEMSGTLELAMGEAALTGFLAWLESAPPGSYRLTNNMASHADASLGRAGGTQVGRVGGVSSPPGHRNGAWGALCGVRPGGCDG